MVKFSYFKIHKVEQRNIKLIVKFSYIEIHKVEQRNMNC